jgi:Holliday junction DNA helicase RuvB
MWVSVIAFMLTVPFVIWVLKDSGIIGATTPAQKTDDADATIVFPAATKMIKVPGFRPQSFNEYVGQTKAKEILQHYIDAVKERGTIFPHLLIYGKAGMGKTTLARIMAKELNVPFVEFITSEIYIFSDIFQLLVKAENGIMFLDEIHALDRDNAEKMYSVMEDFMFNGQPVPPFTLVGATTELGEILKKRKPFYDRFKIVIELEDYTDQELVTIAKQYRSRVFSTDKEIDDTIYLSLAQNCRATPRHLIRLLEATIYFHLDIKTVFKNFNIITGGFTTKDLHILKYVVQNEKGVGLQGLASYLDTSVANYLYEIEPYLLKSGLILRTPRGRKITQRGIELIKVLSATVPA